MDELLLEELRENSHLSPRMASESVMCEEMHGCAEQEANTKAASIEQQTPKEKAKLHKFGG